MRINVFVAKATGLSRRAADALIMAGQIKLNNHIAQPGTEVNPQDTVTYKDKELRLQPTTTILLNKPVGYVCSRQGQGSQTVYDLLPPELHSLKPVGRLDKDSSGLLLMTNDGQLANGLTHPKFAKTKVYEVELNKALKPADKQKIEVGIELEDGQSRLKLNGSVTQWTVIMSEGRNRQIRRTFATLGYKVTNLNRQQFGSYKLDGLKSGKYIKI